jgi:hypothetical protein
MVAGYGLNGRDSILGWSKIFFSLQRPDRLWGLLNLRSNGYPVTVSLGLKRQGRVSDHSPPASGEVKNVGAIPPLPHTSLWRGA